MTVSGLSDDVEDAKKFVKTNYLDVICTDKLEVVQPGALCVIIIFLLLMHVSVSSFCLLFDVLFFLCTSSRNKITVIIFLLLVAVVVKVSVRSSNLF